MRVSKEVGDLAIGGSSRNVLGRNELIFSILAKGLEEVLEFFLSDVRRNVLDE